MMGDNHTNSDDDCVFVASNWPNDDRTRDSNCCVVLTCSTCHRCRSAKSPDDAVGDGIAVDAAAVAAGDNLSCAICRGYDSSCCDNCTTAARDLVPSAGISDAPK